MNRDTRDSGDRPQAGSGRGPRTHPVRELAGAAIVLAVAVVATAPIANRGMNWSDTAQIFHFGHRIATGDFPYRDFAYQSGFLGPFVDALFQRALGATYLSSLAARIAVGAASLGLLWAIFRRFAAPLPCVAIGVGMALITPVFFNEILHGGGNNNWSNLLALGAALAAAAALADRGERGGTGEPRAVPLGIAGLLLALGIAARQSNGVVGLVVTLGAAAVLIVRDPELRAGPVAIPLGIGAAGGLAVLAIFLVANSALGDAFRELFAGAGEKKNVTLVGGIVNMLTGGMRLPPLPGTLLTLGVVPLVGGGAAALALAHPALRDRPGLRTGRFLLVPGLMLRVGPARSLALTLVNDVPRAFFTICLVAGCLFPRRFERATGLPHPLFPLLIAIGLGTVWARKLSFLGRHDAPYDLLLALGLLLPCAARSVAPRVRAGLALVFVALALGLFGARLADGSLGTNDGTIRDATRPLDHPMTRGILVTPEKAVAFAALRERISPGDTCFIYGSAAPLYTLLGCRNPTRLDVTFSDAFTVAQAREAVEALHRDPPEWILEAVNLNAAYMVRDFDGSPDFYGPHGQEAPRILHEGLVALRRRYRQELVVHRLMPPGSLAQRDWEDWDQILNLRLHRRRDRPAAATGNP